MIITKPEEFHRGYVEAFNSGDIEAVVRLYEPDGVFKPDADRMVSGHAAIRDTLRQFQAVGKMAAETRYCITSANVALASALWRIMGTTPEGQSVEIQGTSADLLRRQDDGRWLLVVDHPFVGM
jgi:uncharacterized protein (TIGR02246 family)